MQNKYTRCGSYNLAWLIDKGAVIEPGHSSRRYAIGGTQLPDNAVMLGDLHVGTIIEPANQWGEQPVRSTGVGVN